MPSKQKSGLYRSKVKIGVDGEGKDIVKWISGKTKAELEKARQDIIARYIDCTALNDDRIFGEYAVEWYHERKEPFVSASTQNNYRTMLNKHILPEFGDRKLRSINSHDLQRFLNRFDGTSKSQITSALTTLQAIFADAKQDRIIDHNPAENLRRPNAKPPEEKRALTDDERARILDIIPTHEYGLYLGVMYYTGMRPGEVRGLQWGDIDWEEGMIHVQRDVDYATKQATVGSLKTASADRYIPIASELRALLWPHRQAPGAFVFPGAYGKPLAQTTATRMWIRLMVDCGMAEPITGNTCYGAGDIRGQYAPVITPHAMRHNFITMCWEQGLDILITMRLVGHADYQTTRNIYTHLSRKHLDDAKTQLDEMFSQKKSCTKVAQTQTASLLKTKEKP